MDHSHEHDSTDGAFARERDGATFRIVLRGEVVTPTLVKADTMWRRMRGLLGRGALAPAEGLWIDPCNAIHMFFMRFPIDAVFLDEGMQVVRVHEDLRPWRMARGGKHAHSVLELPQGKAAFFNIRVGDRLQVLANDA
ncbi:MAG: putative secreted protein [Thermoleophilia bacterium]|nr:putative secreted protein [Thermoleophilia bacterium]